MPRSRAPGQPLPVNGLLAALSAAESDALLRGMECVSLHFRDTLYEAGVPLAHVYFPTSGVLSLIRPVPDRDLGVEVGLIGREGMAGLPVFLGSVSSPVRCIVQVPGHAYRMSAGAFRDAVQPGHRLHDLLLSFTHVLLTQLSQAAACNALHQIGPRMCRWLIAVQERVGANQFPMTHDFLATMLGVRRATVTGAARRLQRAGVIRYSGGQLTVLDPARLESESCGCHRVVRVETARLLGRPAVSDRHP